MPRWTFCPQCDAELLVRDETDDSAWVQCPSCQATFEVGSVALRPLTELELVDAPPPRPEATPDDQPGEKSAAVTLADLMPASEPDDQPAEPAPDLSTYPPPSDMGATLEFAPGSLPAATSTDFELAGADLDSPAETPDVPDDAAGSDAEDEAAVLAGPGWSEGADRLDEWLVRADQQAEADDASADTPHVAPDEAARPVDAEQTIAVTATPPRRRRPSAVRTLAKVVAGGVCGLIAGYYLLLVIGGPESDALELAQYVPSRLLPASFRSEPVGATGVPAMPAAPAKEQVAAAPSAETPAEIPASFAAPIKPSDETATADSTARSVLPAEATPPVAAAPSEPPPFDESAAEPMAAAAPHVIDAPSYTADQLRSALAAARQAQAGLVDGDLSDAAVRRTKGASYSRFCELAEALTYAEAEPGASESASLPHEAEQLFTDALADAHTRDEVVRIAAIWLSSPNRRSDGIFVAGTVIGRSTLGNVDECQLDLGDDHRLTILLPSRAAGALPTTDQSVGIVGTIVEAPAERVSGYTGSAPQAVWVHSVLPLP